MNEILKFAKKQITIFDITKIKFLSSFNNAYPTQVIIREILIQKG
ncbi:hypothetical protein [Campylobacter concisus]|nr:hypothetical protein [Campylobacter concisus]